MNGLTFNVRSAAIESNLFVARREATSANPRSSNRALENKLNRARGRLI